jgi:hypothetical protein
VPGRLLYVIDPARERKGVVTVSLFVEIMIGSHVGEEAPKHVLL